MTNQTFAQYVSDAVSEQVRTRTGVVVSACHPILGPLYWFFVSEASVNGPDYYSITDSIGGARMFDIGWREGSSFRYYGNHIEQVLRDSDDIERFGGYDDQGEEFSEIDLSGSLGDLHKKSGQSVEDFLEWLRAAKWIDVPAPARVERLVDHGYRSEWELVETVHTDNAVTSANLQA
jgi:hypothetical protein